MGVPAKYNSTDPLLGAGFVEPVGFNSKGPVTRPLKPSPTGTEVGVGSMQVT